MNGKCKVDDYYNDVNAHRPGPWQGFNDASAILPTISVALDYRCTPCSEIGLRHFSSPRLSRIPLLLLSQTPIFVENI